MLDNMSDLNNNQQLEFFTACKDGNVEIVNTMLSQKTIDINKAETTDKGLQTPLCIATRNNQIEIVRALLNQESIEVNKGRTDDGATSLYIACQEGHV
jgi:ankyrin repeat protein